MKVKLIKDYKGIDRKKGDMVDCNQGEFDSMVARGYVADPSAKTKAKADGNA
tara:strand:+ start:119 stop:274 length:156 start_codon:yes stop_codon:yes gene_type:complete